MMPLRALVEKELRQHALALGGLAVLVLAGLFLISGHWHLARLLGQGLPALVPLFWTLVPLAALTVAQALIASEYRQKTQLFLEALPVPLWRFMALKYALGLGFLLLLGALLVAGGIFSARQVDAVDARFASILLVKTAGWILFLHALFFFYALLGRYRWTALVLTALGLFLAKTYELDLTKAGPIRLLDGRFPYERYELPTADFLWSLAAAAALSGLGFLLTTWRDASIAPMLAEPMSTREKSALTVLLFLALAGTGMLAEKHEKVTPVELAGALIAQRSGVTVTVAAAVDRPTAAETKALQALSVHVADRLAALERYLGIAEWPLVFVVYRRDFRADQFENGGLKPEQGLMLRANPVAAKFEYAALERELIRGLLLLRTRERLNLEHNAWLLDGFPRWWQREQGEGEPAALLSKAAEAKAREGKIDERALERWYTVRRDLGPYLGPEFAAVALAEIKAAAGEGATQRFLAAALGRRGGKSALAWWREWLDPWPRQLRRETGLTAAALAARWQSKLSEEAVAQP